MKNKQAGCSRRWAPLSFCLFFLVAQNHQGKFAALVISAYLCRRFSNQGALAHLARAFDWQSKGGRFESCMLHFLFLYLCQFLPISSRNRPSFEPKSVIRLCVQNVVCFVQMYSTFLDGVAGYGERKVGGRCRSK